MRGLRKGGENEIKRLLLQVSFALNATFNMCVCPPFKERFVLQTHTPNLGSLLVFIYCTLNLIHALLGLCNLGREEVQGLKRTDRAKQ